MHCAVFVQLVHFCVLQAHARLAQLPQGWLRWFTSVCYRRKVGSVAAGLAQMFHLGVLRDSLRGRLGVVTGADGWLSWFIHMCVTGLAHLGSLRCVTGAGMAQLVHLCVLQAWISWGSLMCVTSTRFAQLVHLYVLQAWLSWGSLTCVTSEGLAQLVHLCVLQV
jgi:hypothetical protein